MSSRKFFISECRYAQRFPDEVIEAIRKLIGLINADQERAENMMDHPGLKMDLHGE